MMYHPREKGLWDTWMFHYKGTFHLYYLQNVGDKGWKQIGHATSEDLLHWSEQEPALVSGEGDAWDSGALGTGMTFCDSKKFYMTYCGLEKGLPQRIGIASSDDLFHWVKNPANPILIPEMGGGIYENDLAENNNVSISWRDAFVLYDKKDERFHALIAARVSKGPHHKRGCTAHAITKDLETWKVLPPIYSPGKFFDHEVPALYAINGRHYLLWSSARFYTNHNDPPSRSIASGTFYAVSDKPYEGFQEPEDNMLLGSGNGRFDNYVGQLIQVGKETLLHYQMIGAEELDLVSVSTPKIVRVESGKHLVAGYCMRCDALKRKKLSEGLKDGWLQAQRFPEGEKWGIEGDTLFAKVQGSYALPTDVKVGNFMLEAELMVENGFFAGVGVKGVDSPRNSVNSAAILDAKNSSVHVMKSSWGRPGPVLTPIDSAKFPFKKGAFHHLRIMTRRPWTDIFFDDRLCFSLALPWPEKGNVVFLACDGRVRFRNLSVHEIE